MKPNKSKTNNSCNCDSHGQRSVSLPLGNMDVPPVIFALAHGATPEMAENFAAVATPGGIDQQERRGQTAQSFLETLPIDGTSTAAQRLQFEALGFKFKFDRTAAQQQGRGELFVECTFPKGWRKQATDHSMHSDLLDDKGRRRGGIFYKAAFYDQSAHVRLDTRFVYGKEPVGGYTNTRDKQAFIGYVKDGATIVFQTEPTAVEPAYDQAKPEQRQPWLDWMSEQDAKVQEAKAWLAKTYPQHEDVLAYWDLP